MIMSHLCFQNAEYERHILLQVPHDTLANATLQMEPQLQLIAKQQACNPVSFSKILAHMPSILDIQIHLAAIGNIASNKIGSTLWIEPPNAAQYLKHCCASKFRHITGTLTSIDGSEYTFYNPRNKGYSFPGDPHPQDAIRSDIDYIQTDEQLVQLLYKHFDTAGTPMMIDDAIKAYCICGVRKLDNKVQVLRFDPHEHRNIALDKYVQLAKTNDVNNTNIGIGVHWLNLERAFNSSRFMIFCPLLQRLQ